MSTRLAVIQAREKLASAVLASLLADRSIATDERGTVRSVKARHELDLAARDLVAAIDDEPESRHPPGWEISR